MLLRSDALSIARNTLVFTINRYRGVSGNHKFTFLRDLSPLHLSTSRNCNGTCSQLFKPAPSIIFVELRYNWSLFLRVTIWSSLYFYRINYNFSTRSTTSEWKTIAIPRHSKIGSTRFRLSRWKRPTSEQSKSNLDSGAIKANATSHFTIRRVHMVRILHTAELVRASLGAGSKMY